MDYIFDPFVDLDQVTVSDDHCYLDDSIGLEIEPGHFAIHLEARPTDQSS